ncbi:hypothetical protein PISMIDRAFT_533671 [Pisolithus microcarpus 441]|uniref:ABC transmembrane type-1 domain-containing protein n=1 Tax=Pisolithus microcarpus 441 TaxID=765257 RepID=A0A0C9YYH2_9AGAM|nr:hypothetical protein PISMIDRAFT_533671 [Pisolithus microcarpus 441]
MYLRVHTGKVNTKVICEKVLQAILRQDITYIDHVGTGEVVTRIHMDTRRSVFQFSTDIVQQGISEKVALVVNFLSTFFVGFILAYSQSWRLTLGTSSILPCLVVTSIIMNKFTVKYSQRRFGMSLRVVP